jgi:hypothetical protein
MPAQSLSMINDAQSLSMINDAQSLSMTNDARDSHAGKSVCLFFVSLSRICSYAVRL